MKDSRIRIMKEKAKKRASKDLPQHSFCKCHEAFYGKPYVWDMNKHPSNSDSSTLRALYFGYRYGKKLTTKDQTLMSIDSAFEVFKEMFDEFKAELANEISKE